MAYLIVIRDDGEDLASVPASGDLASAQQLAEELRSQHGAYSVRIIDVDGTGTEVASFNEDTMAWDQ